MNNGSASLAQLHDIVLPAPVPWWPPAPGWYAVLTLLLLVAAWLGWRLRQRWLADSYRREALGLLAMARDAPAVAELLRRTALVIAPRQAIAGMTGHQWADWLRTQYSAAMPDKVRDQLIHGVYGPVIEDSDLRALRTYAADWIAGHGRDRAVVTREEWLTC